MFTQELRAKKIFFLSLSPSLFLSFFPKLELSSGKQDEDQTLQENKNEKKKEGKKNEEGGRERERETVTKNDLKIVSSVDTPCGRKDRGNEER